MLWHSPKQILLHIQENSSGHVVVPKYVSYVSWIHHHYFEPVFLYQKVIETSVRTWITIFLPYLSMADRDVTINILILTSSWNDGECQQAGAKEETERDEGILGVVWYFCIGNVFAEAREGVVTHQSVDSTMAIRRRNERRVDQQCLFGIVDERLAELQQDDREVH